MNVACKRLSPERHEQIRQWVIELSSRKFQIGERVYWSGVPAHCQQFVPFEITGIDGDYAKLDLFKKPVLLIDLSLAT